MVSHRVERTQEAVMQVMDKLGGKGAIRLSQGIPFFGPPMEALELALEDIKKDPRAHRYGPDMGDSALREMISGKLRRENGISADAETNIAVTAGANTAFFVTAASIIDPGDEVILLSPYYFNHKMALDILEARSVVVPTNRDYRPVLEKIERAVTKKTKAVVMVSPNNPTGAVYSPKEVESIRNLCLQHSIYLISDETYEYFVFDGRHLSPSSLSWDEGKSVSLFSLSKSYGISGWRIGYALFPSELYENVLKVQDTVTICPPRPSQYLALRCMEVGRSYVRSHLPKLMRSREIFHTALRSLPWVESPFNQGGFYLYPRFPSGMSSHQLAKRLAGSHGVLTVPGDVFGSKETCLRLSFGNLEPESAEEGITRILNGVRKEYVITP